MAESKRTDKRFQLARRHVVMLLVVVAVVLFIWEPWDQSIPPTEITLSQAQKMIADQQVRSAVLYGEQHRIDLIGTDDTAYTADFIGDYSTELSEQLTAAGTQFDTVQDSRGWFARNFVIIFFYGILFLLFFGGPILRAISKRKSGDGLMDTVLGLGSIDFKAERPKERFGDVVGADEAIDDLRDVVKFLTEPEPFKGINIPRGFLFFGPTGTGKTLLARAVAGEAGVNYYHLSGAGLSSMWAGGTTQKIDRFFTRLKKEVDEGKPIVVFMDELDGIASKREGDLGADRDRNSSVDHLLDRIVDFFTHFDCGVLIGATNDKDRIDDAVLRPGRFGVHIAMPNPDRKARAKIMELNCASIQVEGVNFQQTAYLTAGMSGAAVASIPAKAALLARRRDPSTVTVTPDDIERATMEVALGKLRYSADVPEEERHKTGVHEAGHALVSIASPYHTLHVLTTYPIGPSGGSTWSTTGDRQFDDPDILMWRLALLMAGREAELLDLGHSTNGAEHDIEVATDLARRAVCHWAYYPDFLVNVDLRSWQTHPRAEEIDAKVRGLLNESRVKAHALLLAHEGLRLELQKKLWEQRILHSDDLAEVATRHGLSASAA